MAKQANSSAQNEKIMDDIITSMNKDQVYMSLKRGTQSNPREFNKQLLSFLEKIKNKYDGDAKMLDTPVRDAEKTKLEEEILSYLEPVFHNQLISLRNEIVSLAQLEVRPALKKYRKLHDAVNDVVASYIDKFNKECPDNADAHTNFVNLLRDEREKLKSQIVTIAQREAINIDKMQANNTSNTQANSSNTQANNTDNNNKHKYIDAATTAVKAGMLATRIMTGDFTAAIDVGAVALDASIAAVQAGLDYAKELFAKDE